MRYAALCAMVLSATCPAHGQDPSYYEPHFSSRTMTIATQSWGLAPGSVMLLGDSNTEMMRPIEIGGCQILNAGFGGATIDDLVERGPMLATMAKPSIVHVMLGTNDALRGIFDGREALTEIVLSLRANGAYVVLWTLPPISQGAGDAAAFTQLNEMIADVASDTNATLEDGWTSDMTDREGFAAPGWLVGDGIHLTPNGQIARATRIAAINAELIARHNISCAK